MPNAFAQRLGSGFRAYGLGFRACALRVGFRVWDLMMFGLSPPPLVVRYVEGYSGDTGLTGLRVSLFGFGVLGLERGQYWGHSRVRWGYMGVL